MFLLFIFVYINHISHLLSFCNDTEALFCETWEDGIINDTIWTIDTLNRPPYIYTSPYYCGENKCILVRGPGGSTPFTRTVDTVIQLNKIGDLLYESFTLTLNMYISDLETTSEGSPINEYCGIQYSCDNGNTYINGFMFTAVDSTDIGENQMYDLNITINNDENICGNTMIIRLLAHVSASSDRIYYDNIYLYGNNGYTKTPTMNTINPTNTPTNMPTLNTIMPTNIPTINTKIPSMSPTMEPSLITVNPTNIPTMIPSKFPSIHPTIVTNMPTNIPTNYPTYVPSYIPSVIPSEAPVLTTIPMTTVGNDSFTGPMNQEQIITVTCSIILAILMIIIIIYCLRKHYCLQKLAHRRDSKYMTSDIESNNGKMGNIAMAAQIPSETPVTSTSNLNSLSLSNNNNEYTKKAVVVFNNQAKAIKFNDYNSLISEISVKFGMPSNEIDSLKYKPEISDYMVKIENNDDLNECLEENKVEIKLNWKGNTIGGDDHNDVYEVNEGDYITTGEGQDIDNNNNDKKDENKNKEDEVDKETTKDGMELVNSGTPAFSSTLN